MVDFYRLRKEHIAKKQLEYDIYETIIFAINHADDNDENEEAILHDIKCQITKSIDEAFATLREGK